LDVITQVYGQIVNGSGGLPWWHVPAESDAKVGAAGFDLLSGLLSQIPRGSAAADYRRAVILIELGRFQEVLELAPGIDEQTCGLEAYCHLRAGDVATAARCANAARTTLWHGRTPLVREDLMYLYFVRGVCSRPEGARWHLRTAESLAIDLGMTDFRRRIHAVTGRTLDLFDEVTGARREAVEALLTPEERLEDLYLPAWFDHIKDRLDLARFEYLYARFREDPVVRCRKAELLIDLERDHEALELLAGLRSNLAYGLRMKVYASQGRRERVEAMTRHFTPTGEQLALEGAVHVYENTAWLHFNHGRFEEAEEALLKAVGLAEQLELKHRLTTLSLHRENARTKLGDSVQTAVRTISGDARLGAYQEEIKVRSLLFAGDATTAKRMAQEGEISRGGASLVVATALLHNRNDFGASLEVSDELPKFPEQRLFWGFLMLSSFARVGERAYASPDRAFDALLSSLPDLTLPKQSLADAKSLYPLGIVLAVHHPRLKGTLEHVAAQVPILRNDRDRHGIFVAGSKTHLTKPIRDALMRDGLEGTTRHFELATRGSANSYKRTRYASALREAGIEAHQLVCLTEIWVGLTRLARVMPQLGWQQAAKELQTNSIKLRQLTANYLVPS
jgi:tetratricopeptide (TPR) repeat protein